MSKRQGKKCKYLLDASSLYPLLLSGEAFDLEQCAVSTLTEYELGNVLWKETRRKRIDFKLAAETFSDALSELKKIDIDKIDDILVTALERNLTFYDASYAYLAETQNMKLVTEDIDLVKKCKCAIRLKEMKPT
ncbi:MAG TPA: type II toxin-antitoxin system VapC family toxin [Candidatus Limnocylindrales bacterium]|nr:type II toxin-antitoxin system VapC family toxin [Candidatus Limnocylindrales bacterium]